MDTQEIQRTIDAYIQNQELAGGALLVRRDEEVLYENTFGYSNIAARQTIARDSLYRLMSMTKPITAVAVMQLAEQGKIELDAPLNHYLHGFTAMRVVDDKRYAYHEGMNALSLLPGLLTFRLKAPRTVPAERDITIRDLLCHASGLEQGIYGLISMKLDKSKRESLAALEQKYSTMPLDFQPGKGGGYSPLAGFDLLARVVEVVSGLPFDAYLQQNLLDPLGMQDTTFRPDNARSAQLVHVYKREKNRLQDVTDTAEDMDSLLQRGENYTAGCGGLFSTLHDYDRFAHMLLNGGAVDGVRVLQPETVWLMGQPGSPAYPDPDPGCAWGLGMKIRKDPQKAKSACTAGTFGWSGAFGTHFFVSPKDHLSAVWMMNRSDLDGAGSYISKKIEELVFGCFA
ncbi:serine hydrolase domain-containing protein [uncultured Gemmiger sp.]|uniref:serine hydrolase domain-containing protein n=1 Tax=uncultured Gemmiger sp. TaxID=1623490 RepID=UPI0025E28F54|nr:serine hydrolase domain-containing protein [uncultured Gemmiger sp.]